MNYIQINKANWEEFCYSFYIISTECESIFGDYKILNKYNELTHISEITFEKATKFGVFNGLP